MPAPSAPRARRLLMALLAGFWMTAGGQTRAQTVVIESPAVEGGAFFGEAVATLDGQRFIVGAPGIDEGMKDDVGRVYLFSPAGALLLTLTNPVPTLGAYFGVAVGALGTNRIIVGASDADRGGSFYVGEAYLFNTNGTWLQTFANPAVQDNAYFGAAVCGVGTNRVLVGAPGADVGSGTEAGRAYLFATNGNVVRTFNNPVPNDNANFGAAVAALDAARVVVGAPRQSRAGVSSSGEVYVLHTNGTLLATVTNPVPQTLAFFGSALAVLGTDRLVVGAYGAQRGGFANSGEAYLMRTNGALLATLSNPAPATYASFGGSVTVVGGDKILVGADGFTFTNQFVTNTSVGRAYLFSTNGTLLATFTNPANASLDLFGWAAAPVSSNRVVISASQYTVPSPINSFVGRAYLMSLPQFPGTNLTLHISGTGATRTLTWHTIPHRVLQETTNLTPPVTWVDSPLTVTTNGVTNSATVPAHTGPPLRAFRLRTP